MTDFDDPGVFLPDIIDLHSSRYLAKLALVCGDTTLDWGAFGHAVRQTAATAAAPWRDPVSGHSFLPLAMSGSSTPTGISPWWTARRT